MNNNTPEIIILLLSYRVLIACFVAGNKFSHFLNRLNFFEVIPSVDK